MRFPSRVCLRNIDFITMKRKAPPCSASSLKTESGRVTVVRPEEYETQLQRKVQTVREIFSDVQLPELQIFKSLPENYRLKCEFRIWHEGDDCYYGMFEKTTSSKECPKIIRKDTFPAASTLVNKLMPRLLHWIKTNPVLKKKLYTVAFHTTLSQEAMITMVYHKELTKEWEDSAQEISNQLVSELAEETLHLNIIGRSRKQKILIGNDYVSEKLTVNGKTYVYKQIEGCFSQSNGMVCSDMLSWAQKITAPEESTPTTDLLELYCGNCNFTIPLAENFRKVIATEVNRTSVVAGKENIEQNDVKNILLARMSSEEFVHKWNSGELGNRLQNLKSSDFNFSTLFVDPPRSGLDKATTKLLGHFEKVLYISCNPFTLYSNIKDLLRSHEIRCFALFDQFPYTGHIECGAYFVRHHT